MPAFVLDNYRPFRLLPFPDGPHRFGGSTAHHGLVPKGTDVPVQHVLSLDLTDSLIPISNDAGIETLPLFYPFKYGYGGPEMQYAVHSDTEIEILHMSDSEPDEPDEQYLQVEELPAANMSLTPLTYEQARILGFLSTNGYFQPSKDDNKILDQLDTNNLVKVGGFHPRIPNAPDVVCHNPTCEFNGRRVYFDAIVLMPPISINGRDDFWCEFQGALMKFCFGLCRYCGTVITFNVGS
jgi:hypothetical protein